MRVLQVNKFFHEKGGTERYFFALSSALAERGHEIVHFSMRHRDNLESPDASYFVGEKDYGDSTPAPRRLRESVSFVRSSEAAAQMRRLLRDRRPEIAHLHNIYHQITPSIIPVIAEAGIPIVMTLHDYKLICPNYSLFDGRAYCFRCRGGRFHQAAFARCSGGSFVRGALLALEAYHQKRTGVYDAVRFFLAPSRFIRERFAAEGFAEERLVYLPPFVDPPAAANGSGASPLAASPGAGGGGPPRSPYVLYFGRLSPEKGLFTLLGAAACLGDVAFVIAGDGPLRGALAAEKEKRGLDNVHFTGFLARRAMDSVLRGARLVVLPTESPENAPFTVLEAMAEGVPVVVSGMGGLPELAEEGGGRVFTAGRADELAREIRALWDDERLREDVGRRSRRAVAEEHGVQAHVSRLESIYARAAKGAAA